MASRLAQAQHGLRELVKGACAGVALQGVPGTSVVIAARRIADRSPLLRQMEGRVGRFR
jgi:hypothetical protein